MIQLQQTLVVSPYIQRFRCFAEITCLFQWPRQYVGNLENEGMTLLYTTDFGPNDKNFIPFPIVDKNFTSFPTGEGRGDLICNLDLFVERNQLITCQDFSIENGEDGAILITKHAK